MQSDTRTLTRNSATIWIVQSDHTLYAETLAVLDEDERGRSMRLIRASDCAIFVKTHAVLRILLSTILECPPNEIRFSKTGSGKPMLSPHHAHEDIEFSISHTAGFGAIALSRRGPIGLDIERQRDVSDRFRITTDVFGFEVARQLASFGETQQHEIFLRLWTAAESYVKATGLGLAEALKDIPVSLSGDGTAILTRDYGWKLYSIALAPKWIGSVVVRSGYSTSDPVSAPEVITFTDL
jgi:4'-phosphopantetheinyl transferase